jgi:hypothetical protein
VSFTAPRQPLVLQALQYNPICCSIPPMESSCSDTLNPFRILWCRYRYCTCACDTHLQASTRPRHSRIFSTQIFSSHQAATFLWKISARLTGAQRSLEAPSGCRQAHPPPPREQSRTCSLQTSGSRSCVPAPSRRGWPACRGLPPCSAARRLRVGEAIEGRRMCAGVTRHTPGTVPRELHVRPQMIKQ